MNFLEEKRSEIDGRLKELKPLYEEYLTLQKAKAALDGVNQPRRSAGGPRRGRRGRPRGSGGTSKKALEAIRKNPGITVTELSRELKMRHPNYLYRVLPKLEAEGAIRKDGKSWHAT
jgi:winged helix-turn-helix DNA-binding protein